MTDKQSKTTGRGNVDWTLTLFGSAIGAGILFLPIQASQCGLWMTVLQLLLALPIIYCAHRMYAGIAIHVEDASDYTAAIGKLTHPWFGFMVTLCFSLLLLLWLILYSTAMNNGVGEYIVNHELAEMNPARKPWLSLGILTLFLGTMRFAKRFLIRIMGGLSMTLILLLTGLSLLMSETWRFDDLLEFPVVAKAPSDFLLLYPILLQSLIFFPAISCMVLIFRSQTALVHEAEKRTRRIIWRTCVLLVGFTTLFVMSCLFALTEGQEQMAAAKNLSILDVLGEGGGTPLLGEIGPLVSIFALSTSFCGMFLGFRDSVLGLFAKSKMSMATQENIFYLGTLAVLWWGAVYNAPIVPVIGEVSAPLAAFFFFILPVYVYVRHKSRLRETRLATGIVFCSGVLLIVSFFLGKL